MLYTEHMENRKVIDTLAEFHMQHPDDAVYSRIAHLINVLESYKQSDIDIAYRNVTNILGEIESSRILHVICQIDHVDYLALMQDCQTVTAKRVSPRILLHLALLPVGYVANKLQIDDYFASQLLDQFHKHFTIDDPILWLKRFLTITEQERLRYDNEIHDLLLGRAVTNAPRDTHQFHRRDELYRLRPD